MIDIMLDLETMGKGNNAAIAAIGAVNFDLTTGEIGEGFYEVVDLESSVAAGGVMDVSTVLWWMQQSDTARAEFKREGKHIQVALVLFQEYLRSFKDEVSIWGNGAVFDNVILKSAYDRGHLTVPWKFWNDRCYRTMRAMLPKVTLPEIAGTHHRAIDDARWQAQYLIEAWKLREQN